MSTTALTPSGMEESRGQQVVIISAFFTALAFIIVVMRLITRFVILGCQGLEDWIIMVAMLGSIGLTALTIEQVHYGLGKHIVTLASHDLTLSLKSLWGAIMIYYFSLGCVKTSVLLQYLRVFPTTAMRWTCYTLLALVGTYTVISVFIAGFDCAPVALFWDKSLSGKCINGLAFWFANAAFNILSDIAILIAPMPVLKSLNLGKKQKIALFGIFALGGFTIVVSILRLKSLYTISVSADPTWDNVGAATWSSLEVNVALICACLPVLRPLVTRFFSRAFASTADSSLTSRTLTNRYRISKMPTYVESVSDREDSPAPRRGAEKGEVVVSGSQENIVEAGMAGVLVSTDYFVQRVQTTGSEETFKGEVSASAHSACSSERDLPLHKP